MATKARFVLPAEMIFSFLCIAGIGAAMRWGTKEYQKFENYGKPKRYNVDRWDRRMMERDSRLTGNVNFQRCEVEAPKSFATNSALELEERFITFLQQAMIKRDLLKKLDHDRSPGVHQGTFTKYPVPSLLPLLVPSGKPFKPTAQTNYFLQISKTWDNGNRSVRERILQEFVSGNRSKTGPQLEREFSNGASLFLTRLTAWLRLTYLIGHSLGLQLRAIAIFVAASSGHRFLGEFVEVGGILTVLEILGLNQVKESDKADALRLLLHVANAGRKYKEFICESYGVRAIVDCLARSRSEITQDCAKNLLYQLGLGNPKFLSQIYKALLSLLTAPIGSPASQQMAGQALRMLLPSVTTIHASVVDATITLLKSPHIEIQYEGYEILRVLAARPTLQEPLLNQLINVLKIHVEEVQDEDVEVADRRRRGKSISMGEGGKGGGITGLQLGGKNEEAKPNENLASAFIQQGYAARLLGVIAATSTELASRMVQLQVVCGLLRTLANVAHPDSQRYSCNTLMEKPDTFYKELTREQVRYLRRNNVKVQLTEPPTGPLPAQHQENQEQQQPQAQSQTPEPPGIPHGIWKSTADGNENVSDFVESVAAVGDDGNDSGEEARGSRKQGSTMFPPSRERKTTGGERRRSSAKPDDHQSQASKGAKASLKKQDQQQQPRAEPKPVQELYVPFAQSTAQTSSFASTRFSGDNFVDSRDRFDTELDKMRVNSKKGKEGKKLDADATIPGPTLLSAKEFTVEQAKSRIQEPQ
ncbi:hypothetical protein BJ742DRAFT_855795 [Cladochytrium replicatum]|nr:hypothetical protein BJ742DRAFT_855795 [Cladochytrium replicatum]